jgi:hypothetical protein
MFKPLTRSIKTPHRPNAGFAETQFLHQAEDDDYSGFAPTQMADEDDAAHAPALEDVVAPTPAATRAAASSSRTALERAATAPVQPAEPAPEAVEEPSIPQSWVTSQWVAAQEAKAHEAAHQARVVIEAQRRAEEQAEPDVASAPAAARTGLGRLRAAFERLLPGDFRSLLPLFIGVTVTMALISAVLPLFDKP